MFYFLFPSHMMHIQYKALPVSYKVLDLKWAIYQKCWLAPERRRNKKRALEKCASQKTARPSSGQATEDDSDDACQIKTLQVTKRNGGGKM